MEARWLSGHGVGGGWWVVWGGGRREGLPYVLSVGCYGNRRDRFFVRPSSRDRCVSRRRPSSRAPFWLLLLLLLWRLPVSRYRVLCVARAVFFLAFICLYLLLIFCCASDCWPLRDRCRVRSVSFCSFFLAMRSNRRRLPVPRYLVFLFVPSFYFSLFFSFTEFRHLGPGRWAGPFRRGREGTKKKNWKKKEAKPKIEATASRKKRTKEKEKRGRKWKRGWVMLPPRWKGGATTTTTTTTTKTTPPGNHRKWERGGRKRKCEEKITINQ